MSRKALKRCGWANLDPLLQSYHDSEWGVPVRSDDLLFEFLTLEGAQAGLSWLTILRKRDNYRRAFDRFDPEKVASYDKAKIAELLQDQGIVRNKLKILAAIQNAKNLLKVKEEHGSFQKYIWSFVPNNEPIAKGWLSMKEVPVLTIESTNMSEDLLNKGFKFVGPTICYSFMQATGLVNDHISKCYRYPELTRKK
jgi:DNA-3-methyladenine glycosylase I